MSKSEVDKYVADPYCGGTFTAGFFHDLLTGVAEVNDPGKIQSVPAGLPIHILSGDKDPVGKDGKDIMLVYQAYKDAGIKDVTYRLYEDGRHEMLNETNRNEVHREVIEWLDGHCRG